MKLQSLVLTTIILSALLTGSGAQAERSSNYLVVDQCVEIKWPNIDKYVADASCQAPLGSNQDWMCFGESLRYTRVDTLYIISTGRTVIRRVPEGIHRSNLRGDGGSERSARNQLRKNITNVVEYIGIDECSK